MHLNQIKAWVAKEGVHHAHCDELVSDFRLVLALATLLFIS